MNGQFTAKQRKQLAKASGQQRTALQRVYAAQNANRRGGGNAGTTRGSTNRQNRAAARPPRDRGGGAVQRASIHARALNPFDASVPGYQLNPQTELTIKRRLVCDVPLYVSPNTMAEAPGCAYLRCDANHMSCGTRVWADASGGGAPTVGVYNLFWTGNLTGSDYVVRAANFGVEISFTGQSLFQAGDIAFLLVEADSSDATSSAPALQSAVDYVFAHPRAKTISVNQLAEKPVRISVPIEDEMRYRAWKSTALADYPNDGIHSTFQTTDPASSNFGFRTLVVAIRNAVRTNISETMPNPTFRARLVSDVEYRGDNNKNDTGADALQRYHATPTPKVAPTTAHSIMDRIGHYAGVIGEVLAHPVVGQGIAMLQDLPMLAM